MMGVLPQVDEVDKIMLRALQQNARLTFTELGKLIGLSAPRAYQRYKALQEKGIITGFHAAIDYALLGLPVQCMIEIKIIFPMEREQLEKILQEFGEIENMIWTSGKYDAYCFARFATHDEMNEFLFDKLRPRLRGKCTVDSELGLGTAFDKHGVTIS